MISGSGPSRSLIRKRWNHSIGFRFTLLTFLLVLLVSIPFIVVEGYHSYQREVARLNAQIAQIEESHIPSIVSSLWLTDYELLNQQLAAIGRFPYVQRVAVTNDEGEVFQTGDRDGPGTSARTRVLTYVRRDAEIEVGTLQLYVDVSELRRSALPSEILSAVGHLAAALLTAATVAFVFRKQVGCHLERLALHAQKSTDTEGTEPFRLERRRAHRDEIHRLVGAINGMRRSLVGRVRERELLMRELHHRIKNDMGLVTSLLSLQADRSSSPEVAAAVQEASQRVSAISEVYKGIYSGSSLEAVDLATVVDELARDLQTRSVLPFARVETESVIVPPRISVAFGIIVNELLTNAAKYSGTPGTEASIKIVLRSAQPPRLAELMVQDNGGGFPEDVLTGERLGFGLTIMKALVEQHEGTFSMRNNSGATVIVRI